MTTARNFEDRGIKGAKIRLSNNSWFVASSFDNKKDIPVFKVDENDQIIFNDLPIVKDRGPLLLELEDSNANNFHSEKISITSDNISSKSFELTHLPINPAAIYVFPLGGTLQEVGEDFIVEGKFIKWDGLGMDGIISDEDSFMLFYQI